MSKVLALLLTDVVDSTQLNDELGDAAMERLWRAHDRAGRDLMVHWRGQEIARSDGFLVLFEEANDAVGFALAYHQALRSIEGRLKARVGLHVGPVSLRENSDSEKLRGAPLFEVDGVALPLVARVMGAALGGQTLLTEAAVQALGSHDERTIKSHGYWRLKGVTEPLEILQIGKPDEAFEPPPDSAKAYRVVRTFDDWVPVRKIPNNLPAERDAFVGRRDALQTLATRFEGAARLVTIVGIGGIGKTRLALRYARTWLGDYPGGAWYCDLSHTRDLEGIVYAVAQSLDVPLGKSDPVQQIGAAISARGPCLVVLDTFEQIARYAEATVGVWLQHAAEARFIVTSREVLGIAGEQTEVLAPMAADEAALLFLGRAAAVANRFAPQPQDKAAIGPLVKLLDGLPLAIELAAARSRLMSPTMLLDRMKERFTLLATRGGRRDRQATLRAALDWSWDLLSPQEKSALSQLSVFAGGFTLEAAEAVLANTSDQPWMLPMDLLQSLVDKSFVRRTGDHRFDLLQSVQDYASDHLRNEGRFEGSGSLAAMSVEVRHAIYFGGLTEEEVTAPGSMELDNLSVACRRAVPRGDCTGAARTLALAWAILELRGPFKLGVDLSSLVLSMPGLPMSLVAGANLVRGRASRALGKIGDARSSFEIALGAARETGDRRRQAEALSKLGYLNANSGRMDEAILHFRAGLELARTIGDKMLECELMNGMGTLHDYRGQFKAALADYERALALARQLENRRWEGGVLGNLGNIYSSLGNIAESLAAYEAGLVLARELGHRQWEGNILCNLGLLAHLKGDSAEARRSLSESLQLAREIGHARLEAIVLCNVGIVEAATGALESARQSFEAALAIAQSLEDRRSQGQFLGHLGLVRTRQGAFEEGRNHLNAGHRLLEAMEDEADLAILLCNSAEAQLLAANASAARDDLLRAQHLAERLADTASFDLRLAIQHVSRLLQVQAVGTSSV
jgi:predicted ATPase/class 3 adenylate cyclase/Tfp pilus assembly protein PilF